MAKNLVIKITHADDAPERANLACNVGAMALASGLGVTVFLAVEGVHLARPAVPEGITVPEAPPLSELVDALYAGATVIVCTPCASRRGLSEPDFREGTVLAGSAAFVAALAEPDTTALVY